MIPLYSDLKLTRVPFVTVALICINIAAFWYQFTGAGSFEQSVKLFGMIPAELFHADYTAGELPRQVTLLTSMFMHGGFLHLGMNMLYLWVFGRNVEDDFGHIGFLVFYLCAGVIATVAFAMAFPASTVPLVGASGAIAGVLGAYFLRFPTSRVYCMLIFIIMVRIIPLPAFFILGLWFFIQIGSCFVHMASPAGAAGMGGVAWISHVAGFVTGLVWTIFVLRSRYHRRRGGRSAW